MQGMETAIWRNGEWVTSPGPGDRPPLVSRLPEADADPIALFEDLRDLAARHLRRTGRPLPVHRELARLFAAITCGHPLRDAEPLEAAAALEIAVIPPDRAEEVVEIDLARAFDHLLVVRITADLVVTGRRVDRAALPAGPGQRSLRIAWANLRTAEIAWHGDAVMP